MEEDKLQPLAIVGLSLRFPGEAKDTSGFWEVLSNAKSTRTKIPNSRFNPDAFYHPSPDRQGAIITKEGCFMAEDPGYFDSSFFAGISIKDVAGTQTACYVGGFSSDYDMISGSEINQQSMYQATGCGNAMLSNRISWFYDLRGPSFSIDTACSSSMVALHEACRELQLGESGMAVVAGTSLMLKPEVWRGLSAQRFLSPDGCSHCFDSRANGYGRGEGVGVIIIKPLTDALRDNDVIRAVIRGSGINQDGKTPAITVPSATAQMSLIKSTYEKAGLELGHTSYFEAHGTGTPVGDPLELLAIGQTIGAARAEDDHPVIVGSVKSNLGHLEGASGIAGVIKTILTLENGAIPAVAEFETPNPRLRLDEWRLQIPSTLTPWPTDGLRRASVNSFGYGGTNAHVILDDAMNYLRGKQVSIAPIYFTPTNVPSLRIVARNLAGNHNTSAALEPPGTPDSEPSVDSGISLPPTPFEKSKGGQQMRLFAFTSPEQDGVARLAETYARFIQQEFAPETAIPGAELESDEKLNNLAYTLAQRRTIFDYRSFAIADSSTGLLQVLDKGLPSLGRATKKASCAFVFTGQGAQWFAMGRELQRHVVFRSSLTDADEYFTSSMGSSWSLLEELSKDKSTSRINEPELSQPLCTALQVALVDLLEHWGVRAKAVVGHSSGEIGAAYAAGVLGREDAWKVAYCRGQRSSEIKSLLPDRNGSMLAAAMSAEDAQTYIAKIEKGDIVVACINSPSSVTISGDDFAVSEMEGLLKASNVWCRKLLVKTAYHSPHMRVIAEQYLHDIEDVVPRKSVSETAVFSSVTGAEISYDQMGPEYWVKNLVSPVRFFEAVSDLLQPRDSRSRRKGNANVEALVEIGPHAALQGPLKDTLASLNQSWVMSVAYMSLLQRNANAVETSMTAAGKLWSLGFQVDLGLVNSMDGTAVPAKPLVNLPSYPFNHKKRYWFESRPMRFAQENGGPRTDLLGAPTKDYQNIAPTWRNFLSPSEVPWLLDHRVHRLLIMPGAVYIVMVMEACKQTADPTKTMLGYEFRDIFWHKPIIFESQDSFIEIGLQLSPHRIGTKQPSANWMHFSVVTFGDNNEASEHCTGLVKVEYATKPGEIENGTEAVKEWEIYQAKYASLQAKPTIEQNASRMYQTLNGYGLEFGPTFQNLTDIQGGDGFGLCNIETPDTAATMFENIEYPLPIHPTVLDATFQMLATTNYNAAGLGIAMLPHSIESLFVSSSVPTDAGSVLKGYCTRTPKTHTKHLGTSILSDESWEKPMVILKNLTVVAVASSAPGSGPNSAASARLDWVLDTRLSPLPPHEPRAVEDKAIMCADMCDQAALVAVQQALANSTSLIAGTQSGDAASLSTYQQWMQSLSFTSLRENAVNETPVDDAAAAVLKAIQAVGTNIGASENSILTPQFVYEFIQNELDLSFTDSVVTDIIDRAAYVNPNLEILEISCGSTTCASMILERLGGKTNRINHYTLTSSSAGAVETMTSSLGTMSADTLTCKEFDIECDFEAQEFEAAKFDYVIFDDLSLSTANLGLALQNIKKLLKPSGSVIVKSVTQSQIRTAFVLGALPSWWRDHNSEKDSTYSSVRLDEQAWHALLTEAGFEGVGQLFRDSENSNMHQVSVMASRVKREPSFENSDVIIVCSPKRSPEVSQLVANCASGLFQLGLSTTMTSWDTVGDVSGKLIISFIETEEPVMEDLSSDLFTAIKSMALDCTGMLWITHAGHISGPSIPWFNISSGLFRSIRSEYENKPLATLDLSAELDLTSTDGLNIVMRIFTYLFGLNERDYPDKEWAESNGLLYVQRLMDDKELSAAEMRDSSSPVPVHEPLFQEDRYLKMNLGQLGSLDTLQFVDREEFAKPIKRDYLRVKILYTGLNFVDIMAALGEVQTATLGCEVGGVVVEMGEDTKGFEIGDTVVASCTSGFGSHVGMKYTVAHKVPSTMTLEEAVGVPIAYMTAWQSLVDEARIKKGESILIHSAAGGVGQASIQLCQHFGLEIFATVGSLPKKKLLMERYGIPEENIFSSRDLSFVQGIRRVTQGRGVDVVLNSVAGELLRQSWHLVADFGRFVEIGKRDILGNTALDMEPFHRSVSFIGFNLDKFHDHLPEFVESEIAQEKVFELLEAGKLRGIGPVTVYDYKDVANAFRALQSGKVMGKVIVKANPDEIVPVIPRIKHPLTLDPNATYLLAGGLGGIGRSIAHMLFANGAKNLAFFSKSGDTKEASKTCLNQLRTLGCNANAYACDISDRDQLVKAVEKCNAEMPPPKGLIQCAMSLRDTIFENMTHDDWVHCTRPKIQGSWNLHDVLPKDLDFFVMLASTSGVIGNPGQANYAAGNTFEDALAHWRRRQGLKATALDVAAVRDVGYLAESGDTKYTTMSHLLALTLCEADVHFLVKTAIKGYTIGDEVISAQVVSGLGGGQIDSQHIDRNAWARDGKLCVVWKSALSKTKDSGPLAGLEALAKVETVEAAVAIVEDVMVKRVADAVMVREEDISLSEPLQSYGVNSLVAVEIRTWLTKEFQAEISVGEISPSPISTLASKIVGSSRLLQNRFKEKPQEST